MRYFTPAPSAAAIALRDLLSDMKEAETPTHNVVMGIGISGAIDAANEALIAEGLDPVEPFTWRGHGDEIEVVTTARDALTPPNSAEEAEALSACEQFLSERELNNVTQR